MSRICVKNLPPYVEEDRLRDFFSQKGEVTDAKIRRTRDGKSRQFAFVGFRTEVEAEEAVRFFNNAYLDTSRVTCEIAHKVGDPTIPRPWSRYSAKKEALASDDNKKGVGVGFTSKNAKGSGYANEKGKTSKQNSKDADPQFEEFHQVMQPRHKSKLWGNDAWEASLDAESLEEKDVRLAGGRNCQESKERATDPSSPLQNDSVEVSRKKASHGLARDEFVTDADYFKSRVKKVWSDSDIDDEDSSGGHEGGQVGTEVDSREDSKGAEQDVNSDALNDESLDNENTSSVQNGGQVQIIETGRLFVRNLPYTATEEDLAELFKIYGDLSQVHLVVDKDTKRSKGIAYILYTIPESAVRALEELDGSSFQGRLLHVMPAKQPPQKKEYHPSTGSVAKSFKEQRLEQKKASEASGNTQAWNSFFMHSDTVAENIARRLGVSKSKLLDREADDLAVRIALGETLVIAETKKALTSAGVSVDALEELASGKEGNIKRSKHVILVKNLPYSSSEGELATMFSKFGSLDKIILPPTKALALVIFLEASEAHAAFNGLAYKRYKNTPLFLEWGPKNVLTPSSKKENDAPESSVVGEKEVKKVLLEQNVQGISELDIDPDRVESRSVYVKNLNFKTTDESLRKHFAENLKEGSIRNVKIKKHLKNGKILSMGFGFIEFDSLESATNACKDLQGTVLEGHALILQLSRTKKDDDGLGKKRKDVDGPNNVEKDENSRKLIVRNVAFEATKKDLRQLFSPFGQIKSMRLPLKLGSHRGFAFVEFVTKQEAQNALRALSNTHLYGRHLVIEQAKEGETLEELRARTAAQFTVEQDGFQNLTKLSKKRKFMSIIDEDNGRFERVTGL